MEAKQVQYLPVERPESRPQVRERFDEESLTGLAQSISESGVLQPLLVRRDGDALVVLDGERRLRAAKRAGLSHVPVIIEDRELDRVEVTQRQLVANSQREDLTPLEKAQAIAALMQTAQWSASQVAVKLGLSPSTVSKLLALLELPEEVQAQVASGALPRTTAYALTRAPDAESRRQLAEQAANGGLTREDVAKRAKAQKSKRRGGKRPPGDARNGRLALPIGDGCTLNVAGHGLTLSAFTACLSSLLSRLTALEPRDMPLSDAVALLTAEKTP